MTEPSRYDDAVEFYRAQWQALEQRPGEPAWLQALRRAAIDQFTSDGFPSTHHEDWRYTSLSSLLQARFDAPGDKGKEIDRSQVEALAHPVYACSLFVFVDGHFVPALSTPGPRAAGLPVEPLAAALSAERTALGQVGELKGHPFAALNTALFDDGARIRILADHVEEEPIHLVFVSTGNTVSHPRVLIKAEPQSRARVIQDFVSLSPEAAFTNAVTEVAVGANAEVELVLLQRENDATFHISNLAVTQARDSRFTSHTLTLGGKVVRNDLNSLLAESGAEVRLTGLFVGAGDRVIDNHTLVDHAVPHCHSDELYKGILAGRSKGVFRGRVVVRPDAQKTDAQQSNPNLLLGTKAEVDTRPQLEIYADDVKCSHGSTIGQIDPEALFFLRARGFDERAARALLTEGFAAEITTGLPDAALGERVRELMREVLAQDIAESSP